MCHDDRHHHGHRHFDGCCDNRDYHGHRDHGPDFGREGGPRFRGPDRNDCCTNDQGNPFQLKRYFINRQEQLDALDEYLDALENEAQGVREAIEELLAEEEDFYQDDFEDDEEEIETSIEPVEPPKPAKKASKPRK
jgi:hypothetical protein